MLLALIVSVKSCNCDLSIIQVWVNPYVSVKNCNCDFNVKIMIQLWKIVNEILKGFIRILQDISSNAYVHLERSSNFTRNIILMCSFSPTSNIYNMWEYVYEQFSPMTIALLLCYQQKKQAAILQENKNKTRGEKDIQGTWSVLKKWISSVQSPSHVQLFVTPWTAARQASLSVSNSRSLLKLMSMESVMPSNHFLLPSIFPSIRVFSSMSVLPIK